MKYSIETVLTNYELMGKCFAGDKSTGERFFHYTSQESFCAMFNDYINQIDDYNHNIDNLKYVTLFASQMQYLNDKQEYKEGIEVINDANIDVSQLFDSIFITCFCGKEDLLSQWKYYGKNCGISIEFDFKKTTRLCWYDLIEHSKKSDPPYAYWASIKPHKVFYKNHNEKFKLIKSIVDNNIYKDVADKEAANIFIPFCKNKNFSEESESRLIFYPIISQLDKDKYLSTPMAYRISNGKIIPQFKCKIAFGDEHKAKYSIPVKSIMIGPGNNQRLVFNSILSMLERDKKNLKFYSDEEIDKIFKDKTQLNKDNKIGLHRGRLTYKTKDNILISMSNIPFRD